MDKRIIEDRAQLADYFRKYEKRPDECKIGLECELFIVDKENLQMIPFLGNNGIENLLKKMMRIYSWHPVYEGDYIIALEKDSTKITLEPAGQLELSGSPYVSLHDCLAEFNNFIVELKNVCDLMNLGIMTIGYHPASCLKNIRQIPRKVYDIFALHLAKYGRHLANDMMHLTTSVQISIDYCSEIDFKEKMQVASYLVPLLTAIYANSPIKQNLFSGYLSYRGHVWENTDAARCGFVTQVFNKDFGYNDYVEYLLHVPMVMRVENDTPIPMNTLTFYDYLKNEDATYEDWVLHTVFPCPEVMVKKYIEIRSCDNQKPEITATIPALIKGIFYSDSSLKAVKSLFGNLSWQEVVSLQHETIKTGLATKYKGKPLLDLAREIYTIAEQGLAENEPESKMMLEPIGEYIFDKKCSPAEELLSLWEKKGKNILNIKDYLLL